MYHIRFVVAVALAAGLFALGAGLRHPVKAGDPYAGLPAADVGISILPVVLVRPDEIDGIPLLPTVVVHPDRHDLAAAGEEATAKKYAHAMHVDFSSTDGIGATARDVASELLPRVHVEMPYYSFGKALPRASKD